MSPVWRRLQYTYKQTPLILLANGFTALIIKHACHCSQPYANSWNFRTQELSFPIINYYSIPYVVLVILADHVWSHMCNYKLSNDEALPVAVCTFLLAHVYTRNARRRRCPRNCGMTKTKQKFLPHSLTQLCRQL